MQLTAAMVGMLGGPALMVWTVLQIERGPRSLSFLCDMTNLSDKTAAAAARKLKTLGMISETGRYVYQIADGVGQLPLPAEALPESVDKPVDNSVDNSAPEELGRKFSDLALNESMNQDSIINDGIIDSLIPTGEPGNSDLVSGLEELGFYGRGLADLLAIPGLTLGEARYQVEQSPSLGAALSRLRRRQPVPEKAKARDAPGGDRRRYIEGEFSDFIEH